MYDSLQALCSYLRGVLCVHAVLVGAGVGEDEGNALGKTRRRQYVNYSLTIVITLSFMMLCMSIIHLPHIILLF